MKQTGSIATYILGLLLAAFLIWFGAKFIFSPAEDATTGLLIAAGLGTTLAGIILAGATTIRSHQLVSVIVILIGIYFFARAAGVIEYPWLARGIGLGSWLAAFLVVFVTLPRKEQTN